MTDEHLDIILTPFKHESVKTSLMKVICFINNKEYLQNVCI